MRKSHFACIALVVTLLAATTCLASSVNVCADQYTSSAYDKDEAGYSVPAWEPRWYSWSYSLYVDANAMMRGLDPSGTSASAYAQAYVSGAAANESINAVAGVSGAFGSDGDSDSWSDSGSVYVEEGNVISASEYCTASATCGHPSAEAYANAEASASASAW